MMFGLKFIITILSEQKITERLLHRNLNYLDLPAPEQALVHGHGCGHGLSVSKLDVGKALWVAIVLVAQYGHSVDAATAVEVLLKLLGSCSVVNLISKFGSIKINYTKHECLICI